MHAADTQRAYNGQLLQLLRALPSGSIVPFVLVSAQNLVSDLVVDEVASRRSDGICLYYGMCIVQPLAENELNAPGFNYLVKYKLLNSDGRPQTITIDDPTRSEVVIHDRETFRQYEISVQSANEKGLSTDSVVPRIGYSGEGSKCQAIKT